MMKFVVIDNEKFVEATNQGCAQKEKFTMELEVPSIEELTMKTRSFKPNAELAPIEVYESEEDCEVDGLVLLTDRKIYITKIKFTNS